MKRLVKVLARRTSRGEHEQGQHGRPHVLCPVCWLNKITPLFEAVRATPATFSRRRSTDAVGRLILFGTESDA